MSGANKPRKKGFFSELYELSVRSWSRGARRGVQEDSLIRIFKMRRARLLQILSDDQIHEYKLKQLLDKTEEELDYSDIYEVESALVQHAPLSEIAYEREFLLERLSDFGFDNHMIELLKKQASTNGLKQPQVTINSSKAVGQESPGRAVIR